MKKRLLWITGSLVLLSVVGFLSFSFYQGRVALAQANADIEKAKAEAKSSIQQTEMNGIIQLFGAKYGNAKIVDGGKQELWVIAREEADGKRYASIYIGNGQWIEAGQLVSPEPPQE